MLDPGYSPKGPDIKELVKKLMLEKQKIDNDFAKTQNE